MKPKEQCPGEKTCTTKGIIADRLGATLENFCHSRDDGCKLFFTKPGTVPTEFAALLEAANELKELQLDGLLDSSMSKRPAWKVEAYKSQERVMRRVEYEESPTYDNDSSQTETVTSLHDEMQKHLRVAQTQQHPQLKQTRPTSIAQAKRGDSGAFNFTEAPEE